MKSWFARLFRAGQGERTVGVGMVSDLDKDW